MADEVGGLPPNEKPTGLNAFLEGVAWLEAFFGEPNPPNTPELPAAPTPNPKPRLDDLGGEFCDDEEPKLKGFDAEDDPKSEFPAADAPAAPKREDALFLLSENRRGVGEEPSEFGSFDFGCGLPVSAFNESEDSGLESSAIGAKLEGFFAASSADSGAGLAAGEF